MPWVRIDENAMDHPKIGGLPDGAFRLWVQGLAYCQKFLTDGYVSDLAVRGLRSYSPKRKALLVDAGLWDVSETGIRVHDFLDWNESREHVTAVRKLARDRMQKHRLGSREPKENNARTNGEGSAFVPSGVCERSDPVTEIRERGLGKTFRPTPRVPSLDSPLDATAERAGRFCERYAEMYARYRKGARYLSKPALDFQEALQLCQTWEDARLDKIAQCFLQTDHPFAEKGSRTMAQFRSLASWCDSQLVEAGIA